MTVERRDRDVVHPGRPARSPGAASRSTGDLAGVTIRHSHPGPRLGPPMRLRPELPTEPSLELIDAPVCITIEHSIVGAIQVTRDEVRKIRC